MIVLLVATAVWAQRGLRGFRSFDDEEELPLPADATEKTEFLFARLRYDSVRGSWGWRGGAWATDYPKADRQFLQGLRRLSRVHARSVEEVVDVNSDQIYRYPWLYAVEVGRWELSDSQARRLRDYLDRGGFLMVDDFHGYWEWDVFLHSLRKVFPDRAVVDLESSDPIFHVLYDLDQRVQIPGIHTLFSGSTSEKGGVDPKWRGVYDDRGRLVVAICHNMDLGDAWEWADHPDYPERYAALAYRIALNYIIYAMTH
ncbi:MAG: DUF4159 domain-containing protein [Bryobacteraceae bacterium]|nr:DUF4159 domain-containing protein [Bryobacteraceae bacterium]MDW8378383.1 DUF4159 domain-containing protein [Bryobacterales bacterium]